MSEQTKPPSLNRIQFDGHEFILKSYFDAQALEIEKLKSELEAVRDKYEELTSYMPKIPTEPYEKRLARECRTLQSRVEKLKTELKRMHSCAYHSLLEATAWMGIPEKKRDNFIKDQMGNADFILDKALTEDAKLESESVK